MLFRALEVLRNKYLKGGSVCQSKVRNGSQFWQGLMSVKDWYVKGTSWSLGNGTKIKFWQDVWIDNCPFKIRFHRLFRISRQQEWSVADMHGIEWQLDFRRNLG